MVELVGELVVLFGRILGKELEEDVDEHQVVFTDVHLGLGVVHDVEADDVH